MKYQYCIIFSTLYNSSYKHSYIKDHKPLFWGLQILQILWIFETSMKSIVTQIAEDYRFLTCRCCAWKFLNTYLYIATTQSLVIVSSYSFMYGQIDLCVSHFRNIDKWLTCKMTWLCNLIPRPLLFIFIAAENHHK